jgi:xyloglucan-specific endo-beta-1,4-glucanase
MRCADDRCKNTFFKYLVANYASNGFTNNLYLQTVQAGTEVFTGSNAKLTTTAYSIAIN